jgi:hypothetical protein
MKAKRVIPIIIIIMSHTVIADAQECGPSCPVCSGSGDNLGALLASKSLLANGLYIPEGEDETGVLNLRYGLSKWADIGIGYTIKAEKPIWSIRLQPFLEYENSWRPGVILGTGSVQTGESDQSVFIQLTKAHEFSEWIALRMSMGISTLAPDFNEIYGLTGITLTVKERLSPFARYDGHNSHLGLSWIPADWLVISSLLLEMRDPAISVGFRWNLATSSAADENY